MGQDNVQEARMHGLPAVQNINHKQNKKSVTCGGQNSFHA